MSKVIVVTGASNGFGALIARALAEVGHVVYAGMRETLARNAARVQETADLAAKLAIALHPIELDVSSQESVDDAISRIDDDNGRIDVVVHNAGRNARGPAEAFTPEQFAELLDVNMVSTQRVNRAVLPRMRARGTGLVLWISSSSVKGGTPPYLAPYFAAKAAMDSLAVSYAAELARWGIETSIVVPGAFTKGTSHFTHSVRPSDAAVETEYESRYGDFSEEIGQKLAAMAPDDADVSLVAEEVVRIVNLPVGQRPYRVHIDPADDGSEEVSEVADMNRRKFFARMDLVDLLSINT